MIWVCLKPIEVDVRIVGAANVNLAAMAKKGNFKRDLLDRLSFEVLFLPPLRYRSEDILLLANHFATRMFFELDKDDCSFTSEAISALENYNWPGNVRELKNVVERAVYQARGAHISNIVFDPFCSPYDGLPESVLEEKEDKKDIDTQAKAEFSTEDFKPVNFKTAIQSYEIELIEGAMSAAKYNQKRAAELLDLSYDQFRGKIKKYADRY